ncbi:MAG TPA: MAC/perforin domain-containing protein [Rhizomicrobium sp.]|jgi:hypothetical protein|nr:MAC/perforin domain-containing protein [Rhizomicrobium sp.]
MANPTDLPSGCLDALQRGFNLLRGDFLGNPVFAYNPNGTVLLGGTTYAIPNTIVAEEVNRSKTCETTLMLQTQEDYKTSFSLSVSASMSYGIYSMSASSSLTSADELFTSSTKTYAVNMFKKILFSLRRNPADLDGTYALAGDFKKSLAELPKTLDDKTYSVFLNFFDLYGTHFLQQGYFGGSFSMNSGIDDEVVKKNDEQTIKASLEAGFSGLVSKGSISIDTAYSSSDFLQTNKTSTEITFTWIGGTQNDNKQTFVDSIDARPVLVIDMCDQEDKPVFLPIHLLVPADQQALLQSALARYLGATGMIGLPVDMRWSENSGVTTKATQDGFVLASRFRRTADAVGSVSLATGPDENPQPGSLAAAAGAAYMKGINGGEPNPNTGSNYWLDCTSIALPVRYGDHYSAKFARTGAASPGGRFAFAPLSLPAGTTLGAWTFVGSNQGKSGAGELDQTAATDGFAFVSLTADTDNARGLAEILLQAGTSLAMTSCHFFSPTGALSIAQSLCAPIAAGSNWAVRWTPTCAFPRVDVFWMPIQGGGVKLGAPQKRDPNTTYTAEEDGFLHGSANIVMEGPIPQLRAYVAQSQSDLSQMVAAPDNYPPVACTAAHLWTASDRICPAGAIFLPVPRGTAYQAPGYRDIVDADTTLNWTPLTPT